MSASDNVPPAEFRVWEGIYEDFPAEDPEEAFLSDRWIDKLAAEARAAFSSLSEPRPAARISEVTLSHEYPLPVMVAFAASELNRPVRVLDFGGGLAATYPAVVMSLPRADLADFHVVETAALSALGRKLFGDVANLHFHDAAPRPPEQFDIVHAGSAMQYVRDWQGLLAQFADLRPRWLVFGNLLAGSIRTFVTRQNYYGRQIPVRFLNLDEFLTVIESLGYRVIYRGLMIRSIFGRYQPLPTDHFPPEYRLRHGCNLVLVRNGK